MATYTRQELKHDKFVDATRSSFDWVDANRSRVITFSIIVVALVAIIVGGLIFYHSRNQLAMSELGTGIQTYQASIRPAGTPPDPTQESYASSAERAKAANQQFVMVAQKFGWTEAGQDARYYAGITYADLGENASAEDYFKKAEGGRKEIAALSKLALASLYRSTGRNAQAIELYQELIQKPTTTVPANIAQLQLASLYDQTDPAQAKKIYAQIKDADKTGAAGQIATQKLGGK